MQGSQKSNIRREEVFKPVIDLEVHDPYLNPARAVDDIVSHVAKMVAEHGNGEKFEPREWVNQWLDRHVPALGGKPRSYLGTAEGRALVKNVLDMSWSGAYA